MNSKIWENLSLAIVWKVFSYLKGIISRIIIDVIKSNKFAEKNKNKFKMINFSQKFRKYTNFFPNYDLAKLKQIRTMKVCNKIKIIIFDKIN